ncbi:MAG TPA: DUF1674 domain-containing protein [Stellaceae bacterium]|nr:DUF1674 domain-containing protein [Stellaceae bacterium]
MSEQDKPATAPDPEKPDRKPEKTPREIGGPKGPEPTRHKDWERNGRCIDF